MLCKINIYISRRPLSGEKEHVCTSCVLSDWTGNFDCTINVVTDIDIYVYLLNSDFDNFYISYIGGWIIVMFSKWFHTPLYCGLPFHGNENCFRMLFHHYTTLACTLYNFTNSRFYSFTIFFFFFYLKRTVLLCYKLNLKWNKTRCVTDSHQGA